MQVNLRAGKPQAASAGSMDATEEDPLASLLVRFVKDPSGNDVGETVSADGDMIIIKKGPDYRAVPAKHLEDKGEHLVVHGVVDWTQAEKLGREWLERSAKPNPYTDEELPEEDRQARSGGAD